MNVQTGQHQQCTLMPPTGRAPSWELGLDRRRLCLGVAEEIAAVALGRKTAGQ